MRKVFSLLMILCLVLTGCSKKKESGEGSEAGGPEVVTLIANVPDTTESKIYEFFSAFKTEVETNSGGLVMIELQTEEVKSGKEIESIIDEKIDLTVLNKSILVEANPFLEMFDSWFLFLDYEHYRIAMDDKVGDIMFKEIGTNTGLKVLGSLYEDSKVFNVRGYAGLTLPEHFEPIDLGVKSSEVSVAEAKTLGASAVVIVPNNTYRYLAERIINGYDAYLKDIRADKYYEMTDTIINSNHVFDFSFIVMNQTKWDSFSVEQKDAVQTAILHLEESYDAYIQAERAELINFYKGYGLAIDELEKETFFYAYQDLYRGNIEYTSTWNTEYYERILRLGINLLNEREEAKDKVLSGQ